MSISLTPEILTRYDISPHANIYLGYSGGLDSHVLLHLLAYSPLKAQVCAVYIHHGLQREADSWAEHCRQQTALLEIDYQCIRVDASARNRQSPEEAAREARYAAFKQLLQAGDVLMLAQHQDDQVETVLLQLFRGTGLEGLAGMAESMPLAAGQVIRPLLRAFQEELLEYARQQQLHWIEDPSNQCTDFDRNFLRQQIIPALKQRWPGLGKTIPRAARHCRVASDLLQQETRQQFTRLFDENNNTLDIRQLVSLSTEWQALILRHWFKQVGLKYPSHTVLQTIQTDVIGARDDASPVINTQHVSIRRFRQRLYVLKDRPTVDRRSELTWPEDASVLHLPDGGRLTRVLADQGLPVAHWQAGRIRVKYRQGGEKIMRLDQQGHTTLKKLFYEADIPPWERDQFPLIFLDTQLALVPGIWASEAFRQTEKNACYRVIYQPAT